MRLPLQLAIAAVAASMLVGSPDSIAASRPSFGPSATVHPLTCKPPFVLLNGRCADDPCPTGEHYSPVRKQCVPTVAQH